jgi:ribosomal protein S17E
VKELIKELFDVGLVSIMGFNKTTPTLLKEKHTKVKAEVEKIEVALSKYLESNEEEKLKIIEKTFMEDVKRIDNEIAGYSKEIDAISTSVMELNAIPLEEETFLLEMGIQPSKVLLNLMDKVNTLKKIREDAINEKNSKVNYKNFEAHLQELQNEKFQEEEILHNLVIDTEMFIEKFAEYYKLTKEEVNILNG